MRLQICAFETGKLRILWSVWQSTATYAEICIVVRSPWTRGQDDAPNLATVNIKWSLVIPAIDQRKGLPVQKLIDFIPLMVVVNNDGWDSR